MSVKNELVKTSLGVPGERYVLQDSYYMRKLMGYTKIPAELENGDFTLYNKKISAAHRAAITKGIDGNNDDVLYSIGVLNILPLAAIIMAGACLGHLIMAITIVVAILTTEFATIGRFLSKNAWNEVKLAFAVNPFYYIPVAELLKRGAVAVRALTESKSWNDEYNSSIYRFDLNQTIAELRERGFAVNAEFAGTPDAEVTVEMVENSNSYKKMLAMVEDLEGVVADVQAIDRTWEESEEQEDEQNSMAAQIRAAREYNLTAVDSAKNAVKLANLSEIETGK